MLLVKKNKHQEYTTNKEVINIKKVLITTVVLLASFTLHQATPKKNITDEEYQMIKYQITSFLNYYQQNFTEEILDHKYMEKEIKEELIYGYNLLKEEDQKPYEKFIHHVITGGIPKAFSTSKKYEFVQNTTIDLYSLVIVTDPEDGNIKLNQNNTKIESNLNTSLPGCYEVLYKIEDSDHNQIKYNILIIIKSDIKNKVVPDTTSKEVIKPTIPNTGI